MPTLEEIAIIEDLADYCGTIVADQMRFMDDWANQFATHPKSALERVGSVMYAERCVNIHGRLEARLRGWLTNMANDDLDDTALVMVANLMHHANTQVVNAARYNQHSQNFAHTEIERYETQVWANVADNGIGDGFLGARWSLEGLQNGKAD